MPLSVVIIFWVALVPYIFAWKYILQLIREVNLRTSGKKMSVWNWNKGWSTHSQLFPTSLVRRRIVSCIALAVGLGLVAFCIGARDMLLHR
jgi:hypothetical protein